MYVHSTSQQAVMLVFAQLVATLFCAFNVLGANNMDIDYYRSYKKDIQLANPVPPELYTDPLSLLTKYAGMPYNLIYGNPEGDYEIGGMDPGLGLTRRMMDFTYDEGKTTIYNGVELAVPDQVEFSSSESCAEIKSTTAYSGSQSYQHDLSVNVETSMDGEYSSSLLYVCVRAWMQHYLPT